ncbi:hypothetical protein BDV3_006237 [Batrachochytrium dendrobatidis]
MILISGNQEQSSPLLSLDKRPRIACRLKSSLESDALDITANASLWRSLSQAAKSFYLNPNKQDSINSDDALLHSTEYIGVAILLPSVLDSTRTEASADVDSTLTVFAHISSTSCGIDDTNTIWISNHFIKNNIMHKELIHAIDDGKDLECTVIPVSILNLNSVILNALDQASSQFAFQDPEYVSGQLMASNTVIRVGSLVCVDSPDSTLTYTYRVLACDPVMQGIIVVETDVVFVHLDESLPHTPALDSNVQAIHLDDQHNCIYQAEFAHGNVMTITNVYMGNLVLQCHTDKCFTKMDDRSICVSMAFLVEFGLCNGDWVYIQAIDQPRHDKYLVQIYGCSNDHVSTEHSMVSKASPLLLRNVSPLSQWTSEPIMVGIYTPTDRLELSDIPVASEITLARVCSPYSNHRGYLDIALIELANVLSKKKRLVSQGDWIAVPVDGISSMIKEKMALQNLELKKDIKFVSGAFVDYYYFEVSSIKSCKGALQTAVVDSQITKVVQTGLVHSRLPENSNPSGTAISKYTTIVHSCFDELVDICSTYLAVTDLHSRFPCTLLLHGATGVGKRILALQLCRVLGLHVVEFNCYDLTREPMTKSLALLEICVDRAIECAPSVILLRHLDAVCQGLGGNPQQSSETPIEFKDAFFASLNKLTSKKGKENHGPILVIATTHDIEKVHASIRRLFRFDMKCQTLSQTQRKSLIASLLDDVDVSNDVHIDHIAIQTAGFSARNIARLISTAGIETIKRIDNAILEPVMPSVTADDLLLAGVTLSAVDISKALDLARANHSEMIGAPRIPNVQWEDIGGLGHVKQAIIETIRLPLDHPELFAFGAKRRSGILLYGPPGTGKTLVAKAVATTLSLNFFSVKGPELLDMYIGESEANVRRVFQRARDARPCVVFFDELDSVAPKRGEKGDSGGVMDRIVSQLLAELDGMADVGSHGASDVFVIAATNRPDLLDPALLRPGRFDELLYLGIADNHDAQFKVLTALTRKFNFAPDTNLRDVANICPFNYTGADFYALCSDALLKAMTRTIAHVDSRLEEMNNAGAIPDHPYPFTPQYYLDHFATEEESRVLVQISDFKLALEELVPSVSVEELARYERLRDQFQKKQEPVKKRDKGKGRAR